MDTRLYNEDLAPVPPERRTWRVGSFAALWISMSACVPTYLLASGLIGSGMNWSEAILTIFLGNLIVLVPMVLNAHAGTKYGIPFPVYCRASFGTAGANLPAILRALVACGWFGIQAWIGGDAIYQILTVFAPGVAAQPPIGFIGLNAAQIACFLFFWAINMFVVYQGIESIRLLLNLKAPLLIALGLAFLWWAYQAAGGFGPILSQPSQFAPGGPRAGQFWADFGPSLMGMVGFWATLSLNIPDFSRYAASQRDQVLGQTLGLPLTMALYSFIGVAVTSATTIIFGSTIWDPIQVLKRFHNPVVLVVAMVSLCIATLATNLAANVVSPANDFSNLAPRRISFRTGGFITGLIGIVMMPWKLLANPHSYIFSWLGGYGALLGPIGGILIADYFVVRRCRLNVDALYSSTGEYSYRRGVSWAAVWVFILSAAPAAPGVLADAHVISGDGLPALFQGIYHYAWLVGFVLAFGLYLGARWLFKPAPAAAPSPLIP